MAQCWCKRQFSRVLLKNDHLRKEKTQVKDSAGLGVQPLLTAWFVCWIRRRKHYSVESFAIARSHAKKAGGCNVARLSAQLPKFIEFVSLQKDDCHENTLTRFWLVAPTVVYFGIDGHCRSFSDNQDLHRQQRRHGDQPHHGAGVDSVRDGTDVREYDDPRTVGSCQCTDRNDYLAGRGSKPKSVEFVWLVSIHWLPRFKPTKIVSKSIKAHLSRNA